MKRLIAALAALLFATSGLAAEPRIAIIIDDLGYKKALGERAVRLPGPVAVAVLPGTPLARPLANAAHDTGKEILVHLPLQASVDDGLEEPGGIRLDTSRKAFREAFQNAVASVPHAEGVNNHRGSLLTRHPGHMRWLMEEINTQEDWYFVDSFTTRHSVALKLAREHGVPAAKRDVFLDAQQDTASIAREFERLKRLARSNGQAIGIGHPFPETLAFLETALPALAAEGFALVPLSAIIVEQERRLAPSTGAEDLLRSAAQR
ncbi:MAG: divergent polysaccharide deacetylase family protein [Pseudomonadota bacterium]